ncbi:NAD(P)-binding protein [Dendrothele bispora CBS 962.96]|uniref:NAD(P)-binding protein n=1 Tax=Dendrothele bispora (strain CBS 962.96) TaxID=1314807 RepID=A0A4V4HHE1_DENBC|nr:NAD(P)-binding protein [Dendrothele bispora CBS 962.96]
MPDPPKSSKYDNTRQQGPSSDEFLKSTLTRISKIQSHLSTAPRGVRMKGKVCIITGTGSMKGIGRAAALLYAHEGAAHLYLSDLDPTNLPNLESTIKEKYPDVKVTTEAFDAASESHVAAVCKRAFQEEGRLDVFFANAGWASRDVLANVTAETFMQSMRINTLSCFLAIKYASETMTKTNPSRGKDLSGGSIILTASVAGLRSGAGTIDYSASKAAVNSLAKTSAYQLARTNIRVNSICPGLIETGMTSDTFEYAKARGNQGKVGQLNPLGRWAVAEEIAQTALFLGSDDSSYVNGQNIAVDGGLSSSHPVVPGRWA